MVVALETWILVGDRGLDWAEVPVSGGDVNLDKEKKQQLKQEVTPFPWDGLARLLSTNRLRLQVLRMDPRGVCCPCSQSGQPHKQAA